MPPEISGKWGVESLKTRLPLSTLLHVGYSVNLRKKKPNIEQFYYLQTDCSYMRMNIHNYISNILLLSFTLHPADSRVGRGNLGT